MWVVMVLRMRLTSMVKRASMRSGKRAGFVRPSWRIDVGERKMEAKAMLSVYHEAQPAKESE